MSYNFSFLCHQINNLIRLNIGTSYILEVFNPRATSFLSRMYFVVKMNLISGHKRNVDDESNSLFVIAMITYSTVTREIALLTYVTFVVES